MSIDIFPALIEVLTSDDTPKVAEVLDAIGFMVFYNQELVCLENAQHIFDVISKYKSNSIVLWKAVVCLSAFPLKGKHRKFRLHKIQKSIYSFI